MSIAGQFRERVDLLRFSDTVSDAGDRSAIGFR